MVTVPVNASAMNPGGMIKSPARFKMNVPLGGILNIAGVFSVGVHVSTEPKFVPTTGIEFGSVTVTDVPGSAMRSIRICVGFPPGSSMTLPVPVRTPVDTSIVKVPPAAPDAILAKFIGFITLPPTGPAIVADVIQQR